MHLCLPALHLLDGFTCASLFPFQVFKCRNRAPVVSHAFHLLLRASHPLLSIPPVSCMQEWKPSDYKALKRKVAQLLTVRRERELAQGVDRRASKAAERQKLVEAGLGKFAS